MSAASYACCYDASALAKLYLPELGSELVRAIWNGHSTKYATPFCVYETLTILKVAYVQRHQLTKDEYLEASVSLAAWASASSRQVNTPPPKGGGFGLRLEAGLIGHSADYTTEKSSSGSGGF